MALADSLRIPTEAPCRGEEVLVRPGREGPLGGKGRFRTVAATGLVIGRFRMVYVNMPRFAARSSESSDKREHSKEARC